MHVVYLSQYYQHTVSHKEKVDIEVRRGEKIRGEDKGHAKEVEAYGAFRKLLGGGRPYVERMLGEKSEGTWQTLEGQWHCHRAPWGQGDFLTITWCDTNL